MLQLQRASAGSGKTEQLARRYLQLFLDPQHEQLDPASVIATTFTREAAGEILARIFRLLARACEERAFRDSFIIGAAGISVPTEQACRRLLKRFVNHVHRLSIGTIDALFAQQARALTLDLGMGFSWEIADALSSQELAREALIKALETMPNMREAWAVLHHGTRILSFIEKGTPLFERLRWIAQASPLHQAMHAAPPQIFKEREQVQTFLNTVDIPLNSKGKPDGRWIKAIKQLKDFFEKPLLLKDLLGGGSLLKNCLAEDPAFYAAPIPKAFVAFFLPFLKTAVAEQQRLEALRERALWDMMQHYEQVRRSVSFRSRKYTFSEIEAAVQVDNHQLSFEEMALRMDLHTEHLLLDEYQDTSQLQHNFLSLLLGNVLAKGGEVFVVGDVKQGIYGWRGGKRHLLRSLEQEYHAFQKETVPLNQSYRSSRAVLEAVNEVFGALSNGELVSKMEGGSAFQKAAARWSADFQPHTGASPVKALKGKVEIHAVPEEEGDFEEPMMSVIQKAVLLVQAHLKEDPQREVAILVRRTKFIALLLQQLQASGIIASGEGGNPLTDTDAVELLLSLLTWIEHPGNTAAYEHVFHSLLRPLLVPKNAAFLLREQLLDIGIAVTLRSWINLQGFLTACTAHERGRLEQLIALAEEFDATGEGRLSAFIKRLRHQRVETPLPTNVRVLTFHAAKGLEFEAVILMDLDVDITAGGERSLRVQQDDAGHFFIQGNQEMMLLQGSHSLLEALQEEQWAEMLSLLYVGMTRAASYLDCLFFEKPSRKKTMAQWLRVSGFHAGESAGQPLRDLKPIVPEASVPRPSYQQPQKTRGFFSQRHPSEEENGGLVSLGELLRNKQSRQQGVEVHAALAEIEWLETPSPLNEQEIFQKAFFLEQWKESGVTDLELWRERFFAIVKGDQLIKGVFDRVVIGRNAAGSPLIAEIIDFKTGYRKQEELEALYQPQLKAYQSALQELLPDLKMITTRIVPIRPDQQQQCVS